MSKTTIARVKVAALLLGCAGLTLVAFPDSASAQAVTPREAPADSLARNMRVLATSPRSFEALIGAGRAALALGDTQAAAGFFGRAEEVHANSPLPAAGMGAAMVAQGEAAGALSYFARAQQLGGNGALLGTDRGLAYDLLGRHAEAQADYRAGMYGPDADEARRRLALSLAITGDKAGALAQLAPLVARGDAAGARCRALVLALTGDEAGARRSIDAAMPGTSARMGPFLQRLPSLTSGQKAAAVNLGIFPQYGGSSVAAVSPPRAAQPVTGDRLAGLEQMLSNPVQPPAAAAAPAVQQPAPQQVAAVNRPRVAPPSGASSSDPASAEPPRLWLQLASGPNASDLPDHFRKIKLRNRELFDGIPGYVAQDGRRTRLLIGPFKSSRDAGIFAEDLSTLDIKAFSWTSPAGMNVRKLP